MQCDKTFFLPQAMEQDLLLQEKYVLEGKVILGSNIGDKVFIHRLSLTPSDVKISFKISTETIFFNHFFCNDY
jgi:hypothetical protein